MAADGRRGRPGRVPRQITLSFVAVAAVAVLVIAFLVYQFLQVRDAARKTTTLARQNAGLIRRIDKLRVEQGVVLQRADRASCVRTSTLLTLLIRPGLQNLDKTGYYRSHPAERERVRHQTQAALRLASVKRCHRAKPLPPLVITNP